MKKFFVLYMAILFFITGPAFSETYYVSNTDTNCSNSGPGTEEQPFCDIAAANSVHSEGDTVLIGPGEYRESIYPKSGSDEDNRTVYSGAGRGETIILGSDEMRGWTQCSSGDPKCSGVSNNVYYKNFVLPAPNRPECYFMSGGTPPCYPYTTYDNYYSCTEVNDPTSYGMDCWQDREEWLVRAELDGGRFNASRNETDIDTPGKYFYKYDVNNMPEATLYVWPLNGIDPNDTDHIIECSTRNVAPLGVSMGNLEYVTIQDMTIMHSAHNGIALSYGTQYFNIMNMEFAYNSGAGTCHGNPAAISHSRDGYNAYPSVNVINNVIHHQGSDKGLSTQVGGVHVGAGIEFYSVRDSIIAKNEIFEIHEAITPKLGDYNLVIRNNIIYQYATGVNILNYTHDLLIEGNLFFDDTYSTNANEPGAITWRGSEYNTNNMQILNNTFSNLRLGIVFDHAGEPPSSGHYIKNNIFDRVQTVVRDGISTPPDYISDNNLFYEISGLPSFAVSGSTYSLSQWQNYTGQEMNPILITGSNVQLYVDSANGDFHPANGSPVIDAGEIVSGYHCAESYEANPDQQNCRHWSGDFPDVGAYEYGLPDSVNDQNIPGGPDVPPYNPGGNASTNAEGLNISGGCNIVAPNAKNSYFLTILLILSLLLIFQRRK